MTTGSEVEAALDFRLAVDRMMRDPDLSQDALLFCLCLLYDLTDRRAMGLRPEQVAEGSKKKSWILRVEELMRPRITGDGWVVRHVIGEDVPRYEPEGAKDWARACEAPMIRRTGPCGKSGHSRTASLINPEDGTRRVVGSCTKHQDWLEQRTRIAKQQWIANGSPKPPNNTGGVLPRYFNADWPKLWTWAAPWRMKTTDSSDVPPPTTPRPKLRVIQGGAS